MAIKTEKQNMQWENLLEIYKLKKSNKISENQYALSKRSYYDFIKKSKLSESGKPCSEYYFKNEKLKNLFFKKFSKNVFDEDEEVKKKQKPKESREGLMVDQVLIRKYIYDQTEDPQNWVMSGNFVWMIKRNSVKKKGRLLLEKEQEVIKKEKEKEATEKTENQEVVKVVKKVRRRRKRKNLKDAEVQKKSSDESIISISEDEIKERKNEEVLRNYQDPFSKLNFKNVQGFWKLDLENYKKKKEQLKIRIKENQKLLEVLVEEKIKKKKRRANRKRNIETKNVEGILPKIEENKELVTNVDEIKGDVTMEKKPKEETKKETENYSKNESKFLEVKVNQNQKNKEKKNQDITTDKKISVEKLVIIKEIEKKDLKQDSELVKNKNQDQKVIKI